MNAYLKKLIMIILLALVPFTVLFPKDDGALKPLPACVFEFEEYVGRNFPLGSDLRQLGMELRIAGGKREYEGIFLGKESLVKNIPAPGEGIAEKNTAAVAALAEYSHWFGKQVYFALIPTAAAISVESVPRFAEPFNQREFIEKVYGELTGRLTAIDIYLPLYLSRNQYLYYRTENNLTAYGGYHVYAAMARRMLGVTETTYSAYEISYADNEFYGSLYSNSPYKGVRPDALMLFVYARGAAEREYTVTHWDDAGARTYHTLFPMHIRQLAEPGRDMDIYIGGLSAVTDIKTSDQGGRSLSLLIFGDETALAYLPLLVNHYNQVTFVDLSRNERLFADIKIEDYDQVLMAYSVETYTSPGGLLSRTALFIE